MSDLHGSNDPRVREVLEKGVFLFAGDQTALQRWLDAPDPQLNDLSPRELIRQGKPELVLALIEAALRGIPD